MAGVVRPNPVQVNLASNQHKTVHQAL